MNSTLLLGFDEKAQAIHEVPAVNMLYLGGTGCDKTGFMAENIKHQENANMVILDVGNRLFKETHKTLESNGYHVMQCKGDNYNPFTYMKSDVSMIDFANIVSNMLNTEGSPLWVSVVNRILIEYLVRYKEEHDLSELTMQKLYEAVVSGDIKEGFTEDVLTDSIENKILLEFGERLLPYKDMDISQSLLNLSKFFTDEKQVLFLEMDRTSTIPNLIHIILLNQLMKGTMDCESNPELIFFLSEAGNLPVEAIPNFSEMAAVAKKYNTVFVLGAQSVGQLSSSTLKAMECIVFYGRTGYTDAEYLSNYCGMEKTRRLFHRPKLQPIMSADEFQRLPAYKCAVLSLPHTKPILLRKLLYIPHHSDTAGAKTEEEDSS